MSPFIAALARLEIVPRMDALSAVSGVHDDREQDAERREDDQKTGATAPVIGEARYCDVQGRDEQQRDRDGVDAAELALGT